MIIRIILTIAMLVMVHGETGTWTTVVLSLSALNGELVCLQLRQKVNKRKASL